MLQQIQALLASAKGAPSRPDEEPASGGRKRKSKKNRDSLSNLFECLELEEPTDQPLGEENMPGASNKKFKCIDFEDDDEDEAFALWCYLADANDTRTFVRQMWLDCRSGHLSLSTAGAVTECSMGMLQRAHATFTEIQPSFGSWASLKSHLNLTFATSNNIVYVYPSTGDGTTRSPPTAVKTPGLLCASAAMQLQAYIEASENFSLLMPHAQDALFKASIGDVKCRRPFTTFEKPLFDMVHELTRLSNPVFPDGTQLFYRHTHMTDGLLELTCGFANPKTREIPLWLGFATAMCMDVAEVVQTSANSPGDALLECTSYVKARPRIDSRSTMTRKPLNSQHCMLKTARNGIESWSWLQWWTMW